jgi:uncharacterized membrane protein YuzA (DUF378 family)
MTKIVFLPVPVSGGVFPLRKLNFRIFFTVKHLFLKIKIWPKEIGALNWGLAGAFHLDLVATVFGMKFGETSALSTVVYSLVGLAGLYQALTWKSIQRRWHGDLSIA